MIEFVITVLEASVLLILAFLVFRSRRGNFLNRAFALTLLFLASWLLCGFPHLLVPMPSTSYVTMEFRLANCIAIITVGTFLLFSLGFLLGGKPKRKWILSIILSVIFFAICCITDLVFKSVDYTQGRFFITYGPLYLIFTVFLIFLGGGSLICIEIKHHKSLSTDKARASYKIGRAHV